MSALIVPQFRTLLLVSSGESIWGLFTNKSSPLVSILVPLAVHNLPLTVIFLASILPPEKLLSFPCIPKVKLSTSFI